MTKLGTKKTPVRFRVQTEDRLLEIAAICDKNKWIFVGGLESDKEEDVSEVEFLLNPELFNGKEPKMNRRDTTIRKTGPQIGRNDTCPCGSGLKHKKCCM